MVADGDDSSQTILVAGTDGTVRQFAVADLLSLVGHRRQRVFKVGGTPTNLPIGQQQEVLCHAHDDDGFH